MLDTICPIISLGLIWSTLDLQRTELYLPVAAKTFTIALVIQLKPIFDEIQMGTPDIDVEIYPRVRKEAH